MGFSVGFHQGSLYVKVLKSRFPKPQNHPSEPGAKAYATLQAKGTNFELRPVFTLKLYLISPEP